MRCTWRSSQFWRDQRNDPHSPVFFGDFIEAFIFNKSIGFREWSDELKSGNRVSNHNDMILHLHLHEGFYFDCQPSCWRVSFGDGGGSVEPRRKAIQ